MGMKNCRETNKTVLLLSCRICDSGQKAEKDGQGYFFVELNIERNLTVKK